MGEKKKINCAILWDDDQGEPLRQIGGNMGTELPVLTDEGAEIVRLMLNDLSGLKYGYADIVGGCFDTFTQHKGMSCQDDRDIVVNYVIQLLRTL